MVIDNLRWDQWRAIAPVLSDDWNVAEEKMYFSLLPTATQYARNALFAGMTPADIARLMPDYWVDESAEGEEVFSQARSLLFKTVKVRRLYDKEAKALVYVSYSTRLDKADDQNKSRYKTSICVVDLNDR